MEQTQKTESTSPPEPSKVAHEAVAEHARTGGSTFDPRTGQNLAGTRNHAVGIAPEHAVVHKHVPTAEDHDAFTAMHREILSRHANSAVGTHHNPETDTHHLEIVGLTPSKNAALELAAHLGENHVHNLATDEKVPTGVTGPQQMSHVPLDKRFDHLRESAPKRELYSGTHFADKKLDKIEGARRGEQGDPKRPATNADAVRVHLGTQTGLGKDAPGGFYSVAAGHPAPALEATKPHSHPVRGQFAFGSTEHPAFKAGYADGVQKAAMAGADPQTAHHLGLNSAEHALSDAGFDGYYSPAHPGVRFHFGDHEVAPPREHPQPEDTKPQPKSTRT